MDAVKLDNKKGTVVKIIAPPSPIKKASVALAAKVWILINKLASIKMGPKPPARRQFCKILREKTDKNAGYNGSNPEEN